MSGDHQQPARRGTPHGGIDFADFAIAFGELGFKGLQICPDHALDARIARLTEPVSLHADHFPRLAAARDQFGQGLAVGVGERASFGTDPFGDQGDHLGIARIGLGDRPVARAKPRTWRGLTTATEGARPPERRPR
jgi:hypothetical protein